MIVWGHQDHNLASPDGRGAAHQLSRSHQASSYLKNDTRRTRVIRVSPTWPTVRQSTRGMVAVPRVFDHPTAVSVPGGGGTAAQAIG